MKSYGIFLMLVLAAVDVAAQDTLGCNACHAGQRQTAVRGIVADMLTKIPRRDVRISLNTGHSVTTPWNGTFVIDDTLFSSATVTCSGYLTRKMNREEFADTVFLLPADKLLGEVVVWGRQPDRKGLNTVISSLDAQLITAGQNLTFQPLGLLFYILDKSGILPDTGAKARRKREKQKAIMDNY